ncbi:hypothetical protein INT47_009385 [Mucor saturninus]|uniref:F-box domain-containing protein n=1 Tax=Mucor saturninus TaxID=64648 RepID=A0A8H7R6U3_9FUNG|nr:hypothetical protein INT47_009385 [Mucor saturninus]
MDRLPFEVLLQVFEYLPISTFKSLYGVFPQGIVDEALVYKLRNNARQAVVQLISTNLHELSTKVLNKRNESSLSLYFASFDSSHRYIWTLPDFNHSQHYFRVKDAYVSHGKLVLRQPHDDGNMLQKSLGSLWDIRKSFPPTRAGSFSGASEYSRNKSQELIIHQSGCILDSCLIPSSLTGVVHTTAEKKKGLKRPNLPCSYQRRAPSTWRSSTYPDSICGFFLVERLAISIPTFLELYSS